MPATRPSRSKKLPAKLRELQDEEVITFEELELEQSSKIVVSGDVYTTQLPKNLFKSLIVSMYPRCS